MWRGFPRHTLLSWSPPAFQSVLRCVSPYGLGDPAVRFGRVIHDHPLCGFPHREPRLEFPPTDRSRGLRFSFRVLPETTVTTLASRHRFPEVPCPYSAFNHGRDAPACPPMAAACGVLTPLTDDATRDLSPACAGDSLLGFPLRSFFLSLDPVRFRVPNESRTSHGPDGTCDAFARLPLPWVRSDE